MSMMSIILLIGAAILIYIAVQTLKETNMKIASDINKPNAILENLKQEKIQAFNKIMDRVNGALEEKKYHDAEAALDTAQREYPNNTEVLCKLAFVLQEKGDDEEAENIYKKAIKNDKDSAELFAFYADFLTKKERLQEAKTNYIEAVQLTPNNAHIYYNFSNLLVTLKENDAAKEGYEYALKIDPNFKEAKEKLSALNVKLPKN